MSRSSSIIVLGTLIILTPVSGLPITYRSFLTVLLGAAVLGIGLSMRTRKTASKQESEPAPVSEATIEAEDAPAAE
jgi:uncharacterized membrane protein YqgA involved in biofilm formation